MIQEISEQKFVEQFSEQTYRDLVESAYNRVVDTSAYKNDNPHVFTMLVHDVTIDGKAYHVVTESTLKKLSKVDIPVFGKAIRPVDFGLTKIYITDEEFPDRLLDRISELKKTLKGLSSDTPKPPQP